MPGTALRASWTVRLSRSLVFAMSIGMFMSLVGAFGTLGVPILRRTLMFAVMAVGCGLAVAGCIAAVERVGALKDRPLMRRVAVGLAVAPINAAWTWLVIDWASKAALPLRALPLYLAYSAVITLALSVLSWAVFRPRSGPAMPPRAAETPRFLQRLPPRLRGAEIWAVEAEDHYLRLHTSKGSDLILMRLSDAVAELEGVEGAQTHRSWWVARAAVVDVRRSEGRTSLRLKGGQNTPVSRSYTRALRQAGWF